MKPNQDKDKNARARRQTARPAATERRSTGRQDEGRTSSAAAQESSHPPANALLIVLSAPSGAGKTTLCEGLLAAMPGMFRVITCTTRAPRPGERDGTDYHFLEAGDFLKRVQAGNFLEHATVYGNSYGTLKNEVLDKLRAGRDVLLNIDVQGAASVRAAAEHDAELKRALVSVFLTTPTPAELERRLTRRNADAPAAIQKRLAVARQETAQSRHFDYLLVSGSREEDLRRMKAIVLAEKLRQCRNAPPW
jgi:guanylate kinase